RMVRRCDVVAAVDIDAAARFRSHGSDAHFLPNGCDTATMALTNSVDPAAGVDLPPPVAGFIGVLNDRTDLALLEQVVDCGSSLLVVGPHQAGFDEDRVMRLRRRPRVRFVGPVPFDDLPSYLSHVDVGLVPYADTPFNRASFPLKTLDYLAAGRPVVATDLPALRWLAEDFVDATNGPDPASSDLRLAADGASFARAVVDLARCSDPRDVERRTLLALRHDWSARAALMARWCGLDTPVDAPVDTPVNTPTTVRHDAPTDRVGGTPDGSPDDRRS
ncbi:MAG: hypothetical protein RLZZ01_635, partial [Actinomycetota bacterium]